MRRRLFAVLSVLALTLCVGRVAAWASPTASAHACCQAPKGRTAPVMEQCCPDAAATISPRLAPVFVVAEILPSAPSLPAPRLELSFAPVPTAPPGASLHRTTGPARAPPLA
ncbi:MAG TPA: hypothetical protein VN915_05495 [Elusimicrobiota bacterium]|nr:hypothetical protein [Elusimicrobiota bacterium]